MTCPRCGREAVAGAHFCVACGSPLADVAADERLSAEVQPPGIAVTAGGVVAAEVLVRNGGTIVEHVDLTLAGDAAEWSAVEPATLRIMPEASATASLRVQPPRSSATGSGMHALIVVAQRHDAPAVAAQANVVVEVAPFDLVAARIVPQHVTRWRHSEHRLELSNQGNAPAEVGLEATDADEALSFARLTGTVTVPVGARIQLPFGVHTRHWLLVGRPAERNFSVTATSATGTAVTATGVLRQRSIVNLANVLAAIVIVLLLYAAWKAVRP